MADDKDTGAGAAIVEGIKHRGLRTTRDIFDDLTSRGYSFEAVGLGLMRLQNLGVIDVGFTRQHLERLLDINRGRR